MLKITQRDLFAIMGIAILLAVLIIAGTRNKAIQVPDDEKHRAFSEAIKKGQDRIELEKSCETCHNPQLLPLSKKHPPKEQCLICHKLR